MSEHVLSGIDGANPLGFLSAMGVVHLLREQNASLRWIRSSKWTPVLSLDSDRSSLSQSLAKKLQGKEITDEAARIRAEKESEFARTKRAVKDANDKVKKQKLRGKERDEALQRFVAPAQEEFETARSDYLLALRDSVPFGEMALGKTPACLPDEFREFCETFVASNDQPSLLMLASFGSDAVVASNGKIDISPFCFITGSGRQWFLDTARNLIAHAEPSRIDEALFEPWQYRDERLSMRWDPNEDRRYALQEGNPSDDPAMTVWMANLLAYRGLALFPSAPTGKRLDAAGWTVIDSESCFTWPLWEAYLCVDEVASLLVLRELSKKKPSTSTLNERGVNGIFRVRRIQVGNPPLTKLNFSRAEAL